MTVVEVAPGSGGAGPDETPIEIVITRTRGDRIFRALSIGSGGLVLVLMGLLALFLAIEGWPALRVAGSGFLTTQDWAPDGQNRVFGVAGALGGTVAIAVIALILALPVAIATALYINEYAPPRAQRPLISLIDLLAALPSLIYGIWGLFFLQPRLKGLTLWMSENLGFIPFFRADPNVGFGNSLFVCGVIVGLMILPIATSVTRAVLAQAPRDQCESAFALGGTRWGMIREVILPFGRSGIVGGAMLALGRALGETIAVTIILSPNNRLTSRILEPGGGSVAGLIAVEFKGAGPFELHALAAAGLALFVVTLMVNIGARFIVNRARSQVGLDL